MAHIFISYSKLDIDFARHLRGMLEREGFDVWMDESDLSPSVHWWPNIERAIRGCGAFIIIMSPNAKESEWVEREILLAESPRNDRPIFPILLAGEVWSRLANIEYEDMTAGLHSRLAPDFLDGLRRATSAFVNQETLPAMSTTVETVEGKGLRRQKPQQVSPLPILLTAIAAAFFTAFLTMVLPPILGSLNNQSSTPPSMTSTAVNATATPGTSGTQSTPGEIAHNADWKPVIREFDGVPMVLVPPGCFTMGSEDGPDDERPATRTCFDVAFWIDRTEVTNGQFVILHGQAAKIGGWQEPKAPRESVTWFEARDFCAKRGARLPSEAEWEYAARGPDNWVYPWGNTFEAHRAVFNDTSGGRPAEVGSRPTGASWVGALDMSGNVAEWQNTIYKPYPYSSTDGRENPNDASSYRVWRGGSWYQKNTDMRAAFRNQFEPTQVHGDGGFRCARSS
jgi:iron(II)-dependent oxidoreductase